jgi:uncharacterized protein (DUF2147 family)
MKAAANFVEYGFKVMVLIAVLGSPLSLAAEGTLDGTWQTGEDNSLVEVTEQGGVSTGKLVSSDNPKAKIGTEILRNFKLVDGVWTGTLYAAKRGKLYPATITPSADTLSINVSAGMMTKKVSWTKASPVAAK